MRASSRLAVVEDFDTEQQPFSPQAGLERKRPVVVSDPAAPTHSLAGATVLQLVPALTDDPAGRAAIDIALALLQSGARAMVAGGGGPLVEELRAFGGDWLPLDTDSLNPLRIAYNTRQIGNLIAGERIDIVHAQSAAMAWSALRAVRRQQPVYLVTSFPDQLAPHSFPGNAFRLSLTRGDRVIAPSTYIARAMIERYAIPRGHVTVIPRAVDTEAFSASTVSTARIATLRHQWGIAPEVQVVLVPGRIAPRNGQMSMIEAAQLMVDAGADNVAFVFLGADDDQPRYLNALRERAAAYRFDWRCRFVGPCDDMPAALGAADVVVVPALKPPLSGRAVSEAQAMGRPVVATTVGALPENILCPPRMRDDLRTGWLVRPGHAPQIARAVTAALSLDGTAYTALGARARQFAEFMFSPQSVAHAIRGLYTSLLSRDA